MTKLLTPVAKQQFLDNNGQPAVGYQLFTYLAGSTTKTPTYLDSTGNTANTNPIVLDDRGEADIWLTPGVAYKFTFTTPTDTDPPADPIWTVDQINASISPLTVVDASFPELWLVDGDGNGVSLGFSVGDGLFQIAEVFENSTGDAVITVDPQAAPTALISTPDPLTIQTDAEFILSAGTSLTLNAGSTLTLNITNGVTLNAGGAIQIATDSGGVAIQSAGQPLTLAGFTWPTDSGGDGFMLQTDGAGTGSWGQPSLNGQFTDSNPGYEQSGFVYHRTDMLEQWGVIHVGDVVTGTNTVLTFPTAYENVPHVTYGLFGTGDSVGSAFTQLTNVSALSATWRWYEAFSGTQDYYLFWRAIGQVAV